MPELMRHIVARLREYVGNRRHAERRKVCVPFSLSFYNPKLSAEAAEHAPALKGFTRDISETGLALIVPAIRLGDHYLMGEGRTLRIMLATESGLTEIHAVAVRYQHLAEEDATQKGYLIGVRKIN